MPDSDQDLKEFLLLHSDGQQVKSPALLMNVMNAELCKKAVEKVGNPNVLVNLISRRVRQLNAGGGGVGRPLVDVPAGMGMADIALREILEDKIGWEMPELTELVRPQPKKRRKK